jgi:hypothetical protein
MNFGNIFKNLMPLAITAGTAYMVGGSMGSGGSLFASSSWKDKLVQWGIKEGMEAAFGGDDDFVSPYESASVDMDAYTRTIGGTSKGGVIDFPGAIKSADPETIAYLWKQRMNSYISKA